MDLRTEIAKIVNDLIRRTTLAALEEPGYEELDDEEDLVVADRIIALIKTNERYS